MREAKCFSNCLAFFQLKSLCFVRALTYVTLRGRMAVNKSSESENGYTVVCPYSGRKKQLEEKKNIDSAY